MLRRKAAGRGMFDADNGHFHNVLYRKLATYSVIKKQANTYTGVLVSFVFAGLPLALNQLDYAFSWVLVYVGLWLLYGSVWRWLSSNKK